MFKIMTKKKYEKLILTIKETQKANGELIAELVNMKLHEYYPDKTCEGCKNLLVENRIYGADKYYCKLNKKCDGRTESHECKCGGCKDEHTKEMC